LVPSLQSTFQPDDKLLQGWWGTGHLPALWRPDPPDCEPRDLGRGDTFRLSASLFDYTVQSTWNTTKAVSASGIQQQERVEYRGESFAGCFVNTTRFDYNLLDRTQTLSVGVICEGSTEYPIHVSMETVLVFARELSRDFIGQYYGSGQELTDITVLDPSDYRRVVMAVLDVLSTDCLTIISGQHLPQPVLSLGLILSVNPDTASTDLETSTITYANGTQGPTPAAANIYTSSIWNLVNAAMDAVNLDLGSYKYQNIYRNATTFKQVIQPNPPPAGIPSSNWAATPDSRSFYYGKITPPYQTWAQMLLAGQPVAVGTLTGLPDESAIVTTYLCPTYRVKSRGSLVTSVFVASWSMIASAWGFWLFFTSFVVEWIWPAPTDCHDIKCNERASGPSMFTWFKEVLGLAKASKPPPGHEDVEKANRDSGKETDPPSGSTMDSPELGHSYPSISAPGASRV